MLRPVCVEVGSSSKGEAVLTNSFTFICSYQSSFMLFLGEFRKRNSNRGYSNSEMSSKGAAVWRQLPALEKLPYEDRAAELKQKYAKEMAKYKVI